MSTILRTKSSAKTAAAFVGLAASLALCVAAAPANAAGDAKVRIGDLDLSRPEDQATLRQRAKRAARQLCGYGLRSPLSNRDSCRDAVLGEVADAARAVQTERAEGAYATPQYATPQYATPEYGAPQYPSAFCWHK
ncbi:UrcA family protein [Caulobacter sp. 73W]|uniref:UrcA family protein n=1 Tax=Caulobacter sp. 73W TaxID=3161137 RepID=A0AB39KQW5_9CAUL